MHPLISVIWNYVDAWWIEWQGNKKCSDSDIKEIKNIRFTWQKEKHFERNQICNMKNILIWNSQKNDKMIRSNPYICDH